jgi:hypothetical protein
MIILEVSDLMMCVVVHSRPECAIAIIIHSKATQTMPQQGFDIMRHIYVHVGPGHAHRHGHDETRQTADIMDEPRWKNTPLQRIRRQTGLRGKPTSLHCPGQPYFFYGTSASLSFGSSTNLEVEWAVRDDPPIEEFWEARKNRKARGC